MIIFNRNNAYIDVLSFLSMQQVHTGKDEVDWLLAFGLKYPEFRWKYEMREALERAAKEKPCMVSLEEALDYQGCSTLVIEGKHGSLVYFSYDGGWLLSKGMNAILDGRAIQPQVVSGAIPGNLEGLMLLLERL